MKRIEAVIRHQSLGRVQSALHDSGVTGMTVGEVRGAGHEFCACGSYGGLGAQGNFLPKLKLEVLAADAEARRIVNQIAEAARTGTPGDGLIFVSALEEVYCVRTGETGEAAVPMAGGAASVLPPRYPTVVSGRERAL